MRVFLLSTRKNLLKPKFSHICLINKETVALYYYILYILHFHLQKCEGFPSKIIWNMFAKHTHAHASDQKYWHEPAVGVISFFYFNLLILLYKYNSYDWNPFGVCFGITNKSHLTQFAVMNSSSKLLDAALIELPGKVVSCCCCFFFFLNLISSHSSDPQ